MSAGAPFSLPLVRGSWWVGLLMGLVVLVVLTAAEEVLESRSEFMLVFRVLPLPRPDLVVSGRWLAGHWVLIKIEPEAFPGWLSVAASVFNDEPVDTRDHFEQSNSFLKPFLKFYIPEYFTVSRP